VNATIRLVYHIHREVHGMGRFRAARCTWGWWWLCHRMGLSIPARVVDYEPDPEIDAAIAEMDEAVKSSGESPT
jgi:hypothetical protein